MLKKLFLALLVMSILSSGLLFFLLKRSSFDARFIPLLGHKKEEAPAPAEHAEESEAPAHHDGESAESLAHEPTEKPEEKAVEKNAEAPAHESTPSKVASLIEKAPAHEEAAPATDLPAAAEVHAAEPPPVEATALEAEAHSEESSQTLRLLTDPIGAAVFVEGEFLGNTPVDLTLRDKSIKVSIEAPGYKRFERNMPAKNRGKEKGKNLLAAVMKIHLEPEKSEKKARQHLVANSSKGVAASADRNFYIQVKSLPDQGGSAEVEAQRIAQLVREKSAFAVHSCRVPLGTKGNWIRILLGPFDSAKEAAQQLNDASALQIDTEAPFVTGEQKCQ